jgi:thiamine monophosphate kinase
LEIAKIPRVRIPERTSFQQTDSTRLALHGGDDYELLFSLPPRKLHLVPARFRGVPLTSIGIITGKRELVILDESGSKRQLVASGWDPFRERSPQLAARSPENSSI